MLGIRILDDIIVNMVVVIHHHPILSILSLIVTKSNYRKYKNRKKQVNACSSRRFANSLEIRKRERECHALKY